MNPSPFSAKPTDPQEVLLSVVIPVHNEEKTLESVVRTVRENQFMPTEIVAVNDCSLDRSAEVLDSLRERGLIDKVLHHEENQGKGAALRTGIGATRGEIVLIQDADLEYDPREYERLVTPILDDRADVVYGSRFLAGPGTRVRYWHMLMNRFLTFFSNALSNLYLTDMETCYKVFRGDFIRAVPLASNRFGFEPEVTARVSQSRLRVVEEGISYYGRSYSEGKKITWRDGVAALWHITYFNLFADRIEPVTLPPLLDVIQSRDDAGGDPSHRGSTSDIVS